MNPSLNNAVFTPVEAKLAVAMPTYDGRRYNTVPLMKLSAQVRTILPIETQSSLLALGFNMALCTAIKMRDDGAATHFLMLHDDIMPEQDDWFIRLWTTYQKKVIDLLGVVSPIKDGSGLSSVALEGEDIWHAKKLPCKDIGEFYTHPQLLLNTGMMLFDLRQPWVNKVHFTIDDAILEKDGLRVPVNASEDWNFTRMARAAGAKNIYATNAVKLLHCGRAWFPNY